MTGSQGLNKDLDVGRAGFHGQPARVVTLTNAIAVTFAAASLSLCLIVALTALSIKVMAAAPIAG